MLRPNHRCVQVEDPQNLPDHFVQRLRLLSRLIVVSFSFSNTTNYGRERASAGNTAPHPIDLNYVSARLVEEPVAGSPPPRSPSPGTTVYYDSEDEDYQRQCRDEEMGFYNRLISDGGRPSHPINLDYDIARNSEK